MDGVRTAIDLDALRASALHREPYDYLVVPGFLRTGSLADIERDFPEIDQPGSFPTGSLRFGPALARLIDELTGPAFTAALSQKFDLDLARHPTMVTLRGMSDASDGGIHTDSRSKLITVLLYFNPNWTDPNGRLRILYARDDLERYAAEVSPEAGTLLAFRRCDVSFHGHTPFVGRRRALQVNWVNGRSVVWREQTRHRLSAWVKHLGGAQDSGSSASPRR